MDKRKHYTMETGFTSSDFSFYKARPESLEVDRVVCFTLQAKAGKELWYLVDTYVWRGKYSSETVLVLVNDAGVQIETASFGWRRITTEHERSLSERREYEKFFEKFSSLDCPDHRWHSDCMEMFQKHV